MAQPNVIRLHDPSQADRLWEEYSALVHARLADPALAANRKHIEAEIRAHRLFAAAFNVIERRSA